ncbi:MAG: flippase [Aliiglaciecola sp.]|uniref:flippase n=1 Tax=Aliiglaciecola sp. TaxID=1872441 RepID=UPI003297B64F
MDAYKKGATFAVSEKVIKMATQLLIITFLARSLGPNDFGNLMLCYALVSIYSFLNNLGLETLIVKYLVTNKDDESSILTHALFLRGAFGMLCLLLVNITGIFLIEDQSLLLLFIISLLHIFMPFTVYSAFFQVDGRSDLSAIGLMTGNLVGALYVIFCMVLDLSVYYIAAFYFIDSIFVALTYIFLAKRRKLFLNLTLRFTKLSGMLKDCLPLLLSGGITLLYMKVDQVMLGYLSGTSEVGTYVVATRLSEAWYFVGLTLIGVYYPKILAMREKYGIKTYNSIIIDYGRVLIWLSFLLALMTTFLSPFIIQVLYGESYAEASSVLAITIWAVPFVYLGSISTKMYVAESMQSALIWRSSFGLAVNIALNLVLIPKYGAFGAGISTLFAQICIGVIFNFVRILPDLKFVQIQILTSIKRVNHFNRDL